MAKIPELVKKEIFFRTDIKSLLRGLNSLLGLNMSRSRLKSIRLFNNNKASVIVVQIDLVKFILETENLTFPPDTRGILYDDLTNEYKYISNLSGDPKESLFIFEQEDSENYIADLLTNADVRADRCHTYKDLLSAILDSSQINNSILFLVHVGTDAFIVNRALFPDPGNDRNFFYYNKVFQVTDTIDKNSNFVIVHRQDLSITTREKLSSPDLSQMVLPVIHLYQRSH